MVLRRIEKRARPDSNGGPAGSKARGGSASTLPSPSQRRRDANSQYNSPMSNGTARVECGHSDGTVAGESPPTRSDRTRVAPVLAQAGTASDMQPPIRSSLMAISGSRLLAIACGLVLLPVVTSAFQCSSPKCKDNRELSKECDEATKRCSSGCTRDGTPYADCEGKPGRTDPGPRRICELSCPNGRRQIEYCLDSENCDKDMASCDVGSPSVWCAAPR